MFTENEIAAMKVELGVLMRAKVDLTTRLAAVEADLNRLMACPEFIDREDVQDMLEVIRRDAEDTLAKR
jgi:hypothetical protein